MHHPVSAVKRLLPQTTKRRPKRNAESSLLEALLVDMKQFFGATGKELQEAQVLFKEAKTEMNLVNDVLRDLPVTKNIDNVITIGKDVPINRLHAIMKEGDLLRFLQIAGHEVLVNEEEINAYRKLVNTSAYTVYRDLERLVEQNKKLFSDLDATISQHPKLPASSKNILTQIEDKLIAAKNGAKLILTVGTMVVGANWILKETAKRRGCFMFTTINGVTTSCKVTAFSCNSKTGEACESVPPLYNVVLAAITVAKRENSDKLKVRFASVLEVPVEQLFVELPHLLQVKYLLVSKFMENNGGEISVDTCVVAHEGIEEGIVPVCRMCDPGANPNSTEYLDAKQLADNITFKCIKDPSVLEVITDVAKTTGVELFNFAKRTWDFLKYGIIAILATIFLFVLLSVVRLFAKHGKGGSMKNIYAGN